MATYAEGKFKVEKYAFGVTVAEGWCPKNVYVRIKGDNGYSGSESFAKREIKNKSTADLETEIKEVAHTAAVDARHTYGSEVRDGPEFEKTFAESLEPILAEGINSFNGIKPAGNKDESRVQKIIDALRGK